MNTFYEQRTEKLFIGEMTHYTVPAHVHSVAEVLTVTRGSAVMTVNEVQYRLSPGDSIVIFPLVPHSYDKLSEDISGVIAIFPPDIIPEYTGTFHGLQPEEPLLPAARLVGLCFPFQVVASVPHEAHDAEVRPFMPDQLINL